MKLTDRVCLVGVAASLLRVTAVAAPLPPFTANYYRVAPQLLGRKVVLAVALVRPATGVRVPVPAGQRLFWAHTAYDGARGGSMLIVVREDLADPLIRLLGSSPTYNGAQLVVKGLRGTLRTTRRLGCYLTVDRIGAAHLPAPKGNAFRQDPAVPGTAPGELPSGVFRFDHRRKGGGRIPQRRVGKGDLRTEFPTDDRNGGIRPGPVGDMVDLLRKEGHMK